MSTLREHIEDSINATVKNNKEKQALALDPVGYTTAQNERDIDAAIEEIIEQENEEIVAAMLRLLPLMKTLAIKKWNKRKKQKRARCK